MGVFSTDSVFLWATVAALVIYAFYAMSRRGDPEDYRKPVVFWRDTFVIFLVIFLFRGFAFDWFSIPSNSMQPTLRIGDRVLVKKYEYGVRLPVVNIRLSEGNAPRRGDIVVFSMPDTGQFFIKRIIGVPGDVLRVYSDGVFLNKRRLPVRAHSNANYRYFDRGDSSSEFGQESDQARSGKLFAQETDLGWYNILHSGDGQVVPRSPDLKHCAVGGGVLACKVPKDAYFVMGDNRDNSHDSRFWGFVQRDEIVGPAVQVLFNFVEENRAGKSLLPTADITAEANTVLTTDKY